MEEAFSEEAVAVQFAPLQLSAKKRNFSDGIALLAIICCVVLLAISCIALHRIFTANARSSLPTISAITPNHGPIAGGTVITVNGTGFKGEYERVEALVFDGASYIDTGVSQLNRGINVRFNLDASNTATPNMVFGNGNSGGANMMNFGRADGSGGLYTAYMGSSTSTSGSTFIRVGNINDMTLNWDRVYNVNGSQLPALSTGPSVSASIWIGGSASPASYYRGMFYRMRVLNGVIPVNNFMPVRNTATGECGVIDTLSSSLAFYGNSGSGTINCGTTIEGVFTLGETMVGTVSPDAPVQVLIDGRPCTGVNVVSDTELTCHTPSGLSLGKKDVEVYIDAVNNTTMFEGFEYALRLNSIYPKFGPVEGGNTIEIEGGVFSAPPEQYESVDGLAFDGFSWLETGFNQVGSTKMVLNFRNKNGALPSGNIGFFGSRAGGTGSNSSFVVWQGVSGTSLRSDFNAATGGSTLALSTIPYPNTYTLVKDNNVTTIYRNSDNYQVWTQSLTAGIIANTTPVELLIGSLNHGGAFGTNGNTLYGSFQGTIYSVQICKDPTNTVAVPPGTVYQVDDAICGSGRVLVRDFRAARRDTDNAFGLYDMVTGEFIDNAGFGTFTAAGTTLTNELEVPVEVEVTVGGQECTNPQITSPTTVSCVVPASNLPDNGEGRVTVEVFANGVQAIPSTLDASDYYYGTPMVIDSISPNRGPISGGQVVTISGNNFLQLEADLIDYWESVVVTIGGSVCTILDMNDITNTTITCTTGSNAGGISDVFVDNGVSQYLLGGAIDPITGAITSGYLYEDVLLSVSPATGPSSGATRVTISGYNFLTYGTTRVYFGGVPATNVTVVDTATIMVTTPAHAPGAVDILVIQDSYAATLSREAPGAFTYYFQGQAGGVEPSKGYTTGGDSVIINGSGFDIHAAATVTFDGLSATDVTVLSSTQIRVTTPAHAVGVVNVAVTQFGVTTTMNGAFTFINPLNITSVVPARGPTDGGTRVVIYGESFIPASATAASSFLDLEVVFDDAPCNVASVNDFTDTMIICTTTAHAGGLVDVTVTTGSGVNHTDTLAGGFTYVLLSLSLDTQYVNINVTPSTIGTGKVTLYAQTDNSKGYKLQMRADDGDAGTTNDNRLKCVSPSTAYFSSISSVGALADNTWGWGVGVSAPVNWNPVPLSDTQLTTPTIGPSGPMGDGAAADTYSLWYGVKMSWTQPQCVYTARIVITALPNL